MDFIKKVIKGIVGFWVSSAALVALYFCDMIAIGIALSVQNKIPAIEKAAKTHGIIEYVLPALAVFLISLVFVKINKKCFHLTLGKIILRYIALMVFLVGSVVLLAFLCSFVWNLIPEDTKTTIINVVSLPLVFLTVFSHGTFFFAVIPIIIAAFVLCLVVPLSLMAGFAVASFYEKRSRIFKILLKIAAVVSLVLFVGHLVKVGTTITDDDIFSRRYTTEKDARFLEKLHKEGFDFDGKKMLVYLVQHDSPEFILEQVISYGVDVRKYAATDSHIELFVTDYTEGYKDGVGGYGSLTDYCELSYSLDGDTLTIHTPLSDILYSADELEKGYRFPVPLVLTKEQAQ